MTGIQWCVHHAQISFWLVCDGKCVALFGMMIPGSKDGNLGSEDLKLWFQSGLSDNWPFHGIYMSHLDSSTGNCGLFPYFTVLRIFLKCQSVVISCRQNGNTIGNSLSVKKYNKVNHLEYLWDTANAMRTSLSPIHGLDSMAIWRSQSEKL